LSFSGSKLKKSMDFSARKYGFAAGEPTVIIGEIGVNHNGDPDLARRLIDVAVEAGVHVVKFQVFKTEKEISRFAALTPYQQARSGGAANQLELCKQLELPASAIRDLAKYCAARQIGFLCSVFDFESTDLLVDDLKVRALKVASGEVTNLPFLEYIGSRKVGVIMSTGGCTLAEVGRAVTNLQRAGCPELVLLHCVTSYPAPADQLNLRAMQTLRNEFGLPTGFSDHSNGIEAALVAAALGAVAIEKHFTLDRNMEGPDHAASLEPDDLKRLVDGVKFANAALGDGVKRPAPCELPNLPLIRRSLVARGNLRKGEKLTREMIEIKRPADGIDPGELGSVIGRHLSRDLDEDQPITWNSLV
jgi:sialic acid synthase SpsE